MIERSANERLSVHEAICAERYTMFLFRVSRLEKILLVAVGTLLIGMAGILATLLFK